MYKRQHGRGGGRGGGAAPVSAAGAASRARARAEAAASAHLDARRRVFESQQAELEMLAETLSATVARRHLRATGAQIEATTRAARRKRVEFREALAQGLVPDPLLSADPLAPLYDDAPRRFVAAPPPGRPPPSAFPRAPPPGAPPGAPPPPAARRAFAPPPPRAACLLYTSPSPRD